MKILLHGILETYINCLNNHLIGVFIYRYLVFFDNHTKGIKVSTNKKNMNKKKIYQTNLKRAGFAISILRIARLPKAGFSLCTIS
jgi:hypothetical protein